MDSSFTNLFSIVLCEPNSLPWYLYKSTEAKQSKQSLKRNRTMQIGFISCCVLPCCSDRFPSFVARLHCYVHYQIQGKELKASGICNSPPVEFATTQEGFETSQRREMWLPGERWEAEGQAQLPPAQHRPHPSLAARLSRELLLVIPKHQNWVP